MLFNTNWAIFQLYHGDNKLQFMRSWWRPLCMRPTRLVVLYSASYDILLRLQANQSLLLLLNASCLGQKQRIAILHVFGLTWQELKPTLNRTQGVHANIYTINAVLHYMHVSEINICIVIMLPYTNIFSQHTYFHEFPN